MSPCALCYLSIQPLLSRLFHCQSFLALPDLISAIKSVLTAVAMCRDLLHIRPCILITFSRVLLLFPSSFPCSSRFHSCLALFILLHYLVYIHGLHFLFLCHWLAFAFVTFLIFFGFAANVFSPLIPAKVLKHLLLQFCYILHVLSCLPVFISFACVCSMPTFGFSHVLPALSALFSLYPPSYSFCLFPKEREKREKKKTTTTDASDEEVEV